jgi:formylmethanofuran dehydrogenase subunit E
MKTICGYTIDEYIRIIENFHGHLAPGLLIGDYFHVIRMFRI